MTVSTPAPRSVVPTSGSRSLISNQGGTRPCTSTNGSRRLTQAEYQERRARNQCFFCDETFKPGHNCRRGQVMVMEVVQEEVDMPIIVEVETEGEESPVMSDIEEPLIKLQVISDISSVRTMQMKGVFNKRVVHVLVDSGATHNFIHPNTTEEFEGTSKQLVALECDACKWGKDENPRRSKCSIAIAAIWFLCGLLYSPYLWI